MDRKCVGCAMGVVCAYIPEDVQMQICIDFPAGPQEEIRTSKLVHSHPHMKLYIGGLLLCR